MSLLTLLLISLLCSVQCSNIHFVKPDYDEDNSDNAHTLQYYVNNSDKYFTSHTEIYFKRGQYYLNTDVFLNNITDIVFAGINTCNITFGTLVSVIAYNGSNFKFKNISEHNSNNYASKSHSNFKSEEWYNNYRGLIILFHCASVVFANVKLTINTNVDGIVAVDVRGVSAMINTTVILQWLPIVNINPKNAPLYGVKNAPLYGVKVFYDNESNNEANCTFIIKNFRFSTASNKSDIDVYDYALKIKLKQKEYNVYIFIQNALFNNLSKSGILNYRGYTCGSDTKNRLYFDNATIMHNVGYNENPMIFINFYTCSYSEQLDYAAMQYRDKQYNLVVFNQCLFTSNTDIITMISILPASSRTITGHIVVKTVNFATTRMFIL